MTSLSALTRRLAETPADFLGEEASVPAVVSDVLIAAGGTGLDARSAGQFESTGSDGALSLAVHDVGAPDPAVIGSTLKPLVGDVPLKVSLENLTRDTKPQRYTSNLADGTLG